MEHLKNMKRKLVECVEKQIGGNLEYANAQELGEAVDMIKDLSEAIYYCTITDAMEDKGLMKEGGHYPATHYYGEKTMTRDYPADYGYMERPVMYASGNPSHYGYDGNRQSAGESRYYSPTHFGGSTSYMYHSPEYGYPVYGDQEYMGRSPETRRRYRDGKRYNDKQTQMQELEKYAQELASDVTDMIRDASPEEKTMLQQKIQTLASKIK
jgi:hypothetical protein